MQVNISALSLSYSVEMEVRKWQTFSVEFGQTCAHASRVVHTDLKHDNIFFDTGLSDEEIEKWTKSDPFRVHPPEKFRDGIVQAAVSQPLPLPSWDEALKRTFLVTLGTVWHRAQRRRHIS